MVRKKKQTIRNQCQFTVPSTRKIQKAMQRNLRASARNKVSPNRAQKASEILAAISTKKSSANPQKKIAPIKNGTCIEVSTKLAMAS